MADKGATVSVVNGVISVVPDPIEVGPGKDSKLTWTLDNDAEKAGWRFTGNGIDIAGNNGEFDTPEQKDGGKKFKWNDKNRNKLSYKYTVNLVNGAQTLSKDPAIQNGGESL